MADGDDSQRSSFLDEEGKIFGLINIVDALVLVLVLAIAAAGVALLLPGGDSDTRYVTVDVGSQPEYVAEQISPGDTWGEDFTVTDVHFSPGDNPDETSVLIRGEVNGTLTDPDLGDASTIEFNGEPLRYDRTLEIMTNSYTVDGSIIDISTGSEEIETTTEDLVLANEVSRDTADQIDVGDTYTVGEQSLLTVESVTSYHTGERETRYLVLGVNMQLREAGDTLRLGDDPVRLGETLPVRTSGAEFDGDIIDIGSLEEPGIPETVTATFESEELGAVQAEQINPGLTESSGGFQTVEVLSVQETGTTPTLEIELTVRELDDGTIMFRGEELFVGDRITLVPDGPVAPIDGQITAIDQ